MGPIINDFFPQMRNMAGALLTLCFSSWVLVIPFVSFAINELIKMFKKLI